jgi:transcriptional regulator with XRE-family HTH domain
MTPFGLKLRQLRQQKGLTLQEQADALGVSAAYISALEHGQRGKPSPAFVDQICVWFGLIWDDAEQLKYLAQMSHPKPKMKTGGLSAEATFLANLLAQNIDRLSDAQCLVLNDVLNSQLGTGKLSAYLSSDADKTSSDLT